MTAKCCMSRKWAKIVLWISIPIFVVSAAILIIFPTIYKNRLKGEITLTKGSLVTNIWEDIPLPLYEKLYFFNITNGEDFLKHGAALNVTEIGPYTYSGRWVKNEPQWNSNGTVSYREVRTYHFVPELSVGSEDDPINTLNGPMIIAADILKKYNIAFRIAASLLLKLDGESIVTTKTVRQLAYGGYEDVIIKLAPIVTKGLPYKDGIFSWLYGKNATDDGLFNVFTGEDDASMTNTINSWNGQEKLNFWKGDTCNMINGTSIETGPPLPDDPESYTFYQSIFCRSLTFNYTGDEDHYGVQTKRFRPTEKTFANGSDNPDNACFDLEKGRASGVLDIKPCQFDAPVFLSFPHFHMADPSYVKKINGLHPNEDDHGSYLDVEPITGISVDIKVQFQINLQMSKVRGVLQFDNVPEGIFPVFWAGLEIHLTEDWAHYLKGQLNNPQIIAYSVLGALVLISVILIIWSLVVLKVTNPNDDDDPLIDVKEEHKANLIKKTIVPENHNRIMKEKEVVSSKKSTESFASFNEDGISNQGLDLTSEDNSSGVMATDHQVSRHNESFTSFNEEEHDGVSSGDPSTSRKS